MPLIGQARVSTEDQTPLLQSQALKSAGCAEIHEEQASGGNPASKRCSGARSTSFTAPRPGSSGRPMRPNRRSAASSGGRTEIHRSQAPARIWGRLSQDIGLGGADLILAAPALTRGATVVTSNTAVLRPTGVPLENPFAVPPLAGPVGQRLDLANTRHKRVTALRQIAA